MSWEASTYSLGLTLGSATRKLVLMGFANHAHKDGTASFPSIATVAEYAECDKRTVQRHVKWLVERGYMREGDQQLVAHYDARRRPIVYDLSMSAEQRIEWEVGNTAGANQRRDAAHAAGSKRGATPQVSRGDNVPPQDAASSGGDPRGDNLSPQDLESWGDNDAPAGVTNPESRGDTGVTQTTREPSKETTPSSVVGEVESVRDEPVATAAPDGAAETNTGPGSKRKKGTRLPEPFEVTPDMREWVVQNTPHIDAWAQHERFCDYWRGVPGQRGVKLDWVATWRNWMRKAEEERATGGTTSRGRGDIDWDRAMSRADQMDNDLLGFGRAGEVG